jgi:glycosyltransferase involved in cell wall biosynthesis
MAKVCVVVPTKNEGRHIASVVEQIRGVLESTVYDEKVILVVDDSSDDTREVARDAGAVVLRGDGDGLGSAMYKGLKASLRYDPDVIVSIDGDGQAEPTEIPNFLSPIERGEADLVLGSRFMQSGLVEYRYRWINRLGTIVLSRILRSQTGLPLTDSHGGIRAMVPEVVADLDMLGTHTYVQETIIDAVEKGYRVIEIPSIWRKRSHGKSRVVSSIPKYVFYTLPILILRSGQHIRYLYTAGIGLVMSGFLLFLAVLVEEGFRVKGIGHRAPAFMLIGLLVSTGVQFFFFGFVLQLLKQIKKNVDRGNQ